MFNNDWEELLEEEINKRYFKELIERIKIEYVNNIVYPKYDSIFRALELTSYKDTKVLILGQDPYHGEDQANGLAFSVAKGVQIPPSLKNIYKELNSDLGINISKNGDLKSWAKQGILLLNSTLTVIENSPNSHKDYGWQEFTDCVIKLLNKKNDPMVFIFWGNYAKSKEKFISNPKHLIIKSAHPSPLSAYRGFFNSKPFSKTNEFLRKNGIKEINWSIEN